MWCYFPTVVLRQWVIDSHPDTWPIKLVWPWTLFPPSYSKAYKHWPFTTISLWGLLQTNWRTKNNPLFLLHFPSFSSFPVSKISTHGMHEKNGNVRHKENYLKLIRPCPHKTFRSLQVVRLGQDSIIVWCIGLHHNPIFKSPVPTLVTVNDLYHSPFHIPRLTFMSLTSQVGRGTRLLLSYGHCTGRDRVPDFWKPMTKKVPEPLLHEDWRFLYFSCLVFC